jgi:hypothetical protein
MRDRILKIQETNPAQVVQIETFQTYGASAT